MGKAAGLPDSITIGGIAYSVHLTDKEAMYDGDLEGDVSYKHARMRVQAGMDPEHTQQIFFHEVVHALAVEGDWVALLGEEGPDKERSIHLIAKSLWRLCQDNDLARFHRHTPATNNDPTGQKI